MDANDTSNDIVRLNALVDGEIEPSERAIMAARLAADRDFARAHATLARLKACIVECADETVADEVRVPRRKHSRAAFGLGAAVAACIGLVVVLVLPDRPPHRQPAAITPENVAITLAALPVKPIIPDLANAGLRLMRLDLDHVREFRKLIATYTGPRGCRLELRIQSFDVAPPASLESNRHVWTGKNYIYELVAFGMPASRFAVIAEAAERQTRENGNPERLERQLREARLAAPPCAG